MRNTTQIKVIDLEAHGNVQKIISFQYIMLSIVDQFINIRPTSVLEPMTGVV
jgi:hypothetical protein